MENLQAGRFRLKHIGAAAAFFFVLVLLFSNEARLSSQVFEDEGETTVSETPDQNDPVKLFREGQDAHEKGDLDLALKLYGQAIEAQPDFPEAEYQRGQIFQTRGMPAEAEASFRKALVNNENWSLALVALGSVLIEKGELPEAESLLTRSIALDPLNSPAYVSLTDVLILKNASRDKLREHHGKLVFLTSGAKSTPAAWTSRAAIERVLQDYSESRKSLARAFAIEPANKRARIENAELSIAIGDYEGAVAIAKSLNAEFPNENVPKLILAKSFALSGDTEAALAVLETAKPGKTVSELVSAIKAETSIDVGELENLLKENPEDISLLSQLCSTMRRTDARKALDYCLKAFEIEGDNLSHAIGFSAALIQLQRYEQAISLLKEIVQRDPLNHTAHANLATAFFQLERYTEAKGEYIWITEHNPKLAAGFYFLAITHDRLNEYADAMANYQQFLRLADQKEFEAEIDRTHLRLPILEKQIKNSRGKK